MRTTNKETILRARQADIAVYLLSVGVPLVRVGARYKHKEHDSLVFTRNAYFWNSRQEHGNAIDYLTNHMGMTFTEAVAALTKGQPSGSIPAAATYPHTAFYLDEKNLNYSTDKVKHYLRKTRCIGYSIVEYLLNNRLLFQEKRTNNAVFPMYDEQNNCVGAEVHGIIEKRFKGIKAGSKYGYGFNVRYPDENGAYRYVLFFESVIDLLSFIDHKTNLESKPLEGCLLVSMGGLKVNVVRHYLSTAQDAPKPVICVDNDEAGHTFKQTLQAAGIAFIDRPADTPYKDWNEQLIAARKNNKAIERLMR